ncbi:D-amino-acid dehydrogenase [Saccharopolyspora erythraea NRRL 2338]|uniref:D-amino-acid dehydrogenase small subunit n=2 Tax=Saccharopolyspora erythraea TaxID=1836 RepID=A4FIU5_SACEN|nr:FAD-dependent oxidoreductase [Saccharopolyspora erythraea]EQD83076.1 D-amino acid dehydrogenase [Saccharopolyspora erythraea D]PFG97643.1 D-amino-acid dehydrogenase [Saccharopolyspora erythraea NRRL 2338]QRK87800.1 FAD-dependent oxidoreductase [Saccharopolyspora erythraea]CAM03970.1 D-amino-acid dehydrogenase small subunit [Saccharopolyspora erythraea NRRL 2338]
MPPTRPEHVAIVGAGMAGLAAAWFLQQRGVGVTVVDRTGVAAGASWGNAGMLNPAFTVPLPEPGTLRYGLSAALRPRTPLAVTPTADRRLWLFLAQFAAHCTPSRWRRAMAVFTQLNRVSLQAYDELAAGGVTAPTQQGKPLLAACADVHGRDHLTRELDTVRDHGGEARYDLVDGDELRALEPMLSSRVVTGVRVHDQRFINPPDYMQALARAVRARGGEIVEGFDVTDIADLGASGVRLVSTTGADRRADAVVLAGGAWLTGLARRFGVRLIVQAARGYSFSVRPDTMPTHPVYLPAQRVACTPLGDRFRVTGMMEFRHADAPLDPRRIRTIIDSARPMFTGVDWQARREEWVGARPCTADGLPLVGPTASPRVHVAGGHGMWGMVLGPLTGQLLADSITGRPGPAWLRQLDPRR